MTIPQPFYTRPALTVVPALLGKLLCRNIGGTILRLRVTETEAYCGEADTACHASRGRTARTDVMYRAGGCAYVYLCYGIHEMLNVVTGESGQPEAVLIRGVEGYPGPGRLTRAMGIGRELNGEVLYESERIWLEDDGVVVSYSATKRVGIDYATAEYRDKLWRFVTE